MRTLLVVIVLIALAAAGYWYFGEGQHQRELRQAQDEASKRTEQMAEAVKERFKDLKLNAPDIRRELEQTGKVVRKKAGEVGAAIKDATADARITATIKAKLVAEPDLSALQISVNTTEGTVTLSGSVSTTDDIGRAIRLALDTDGVQEVISTLKVKTK